MENLPFKEMAALLNAAFAAFTGAVGSVLPARGRSLTRTTRRGSSSRSKSPFREIKPLKGKFIEYRDGKYEYEITESYPSNDNSLGYNFREGKKIRVEPLLSKYPREKERAGSPVRFKSRPGSLREALERDIIKQYRNFQLEEQKKKGDKQRFENRLEQKRAEDYATEIEKSKHFIEELGGKAGWVSIAKERLDAKEDFQITVYSSRRVEPTTSPLVTYYHDGYRNLNSHQPTIRDNAKAIIYDSAAGIPNVTIYAPNFRTGELKEVDTSSKEMRNHLTSSIYSLAGLGGKRSLSYYGGTRRQRRRS